MCVHVCVCVCVCMPIYYILYKGGCILVHVYFDSVLIFRVLSFTHACDIYAHTHTPMFVNRVAELAFDSPHTHVNSLSHTQTHILTQKYTPIPVLDNRNKESLFLHASNNRWWLSRSHTHIYTHNHPLVLTPTPTPTPVLNNRDEGSPFQRASNKRWRLSLCCSIRPVTLVCDTMRKAHLTCSATTD